MSWFGFGKPKSNLPPATPLQTHRSRQIESLKTFNQNVTELQRDVEYRVSTTVLGKNICLHINLPPQFPQEPPLVKVSPPLQHPWVSDKMIVTGCTSLNNFVMHSDLGQIIRQIVDEFQRNPPNFIGSHAPQNSGHVPYPMQNNAPTIPTSTAYPPTGYRPPGPMPTLPPRPVRPAPAPPHRPDHPPPHMGRSSSPPSNSYLNYDFPEVPQNFPELQELSVSELQDLASCDDESILAYVKTTPQFKAVTKLRETTWKENEEIARANLDRKPEIEHLKNELLEKFDKMNDLRKEFDIKTRKQEERRDRFLPGNFQSQLKMATLQAEEESEQLAERFLDGKIDIDEFKKQFMEVRTLSHCRRSKEERLNHNLANQRGYDYRS